jgi:pimeloyl-ACP methyl ester carboxylesterase
VKCALASLVLALAFVAGCGPRPNRTAATRVVVFVPGVGGDGPWYGGLKRGLGDVRIETHSWGAPLPLFAMNFSNQGIHKSAEQKLATRLRRIAEQQTAARVDLVAHSAGCGVALGALRRLDEVGPVENVVLLAPSVSPKYELAPSLARMRGTLHVFHSDRDTLFLSWRTSKFGTYDNVKTRAAGNAGFDLSALGGDERSRVVQHPYEPDWDRLGNDGGHDGPLARAFIERVVAPLLQDVVTPAAPSRSSAASPR